MPERPDNHLDQARVLADLSYAELWLRYFELGGLGSPVEVEAYLYGVLSASDHEHDVLVHAINERFVELGGNHPIPYSHD